MAIKSKECTVSGGGIDRACWLAWFQGQEETITTGTLLACVFWWCHGGGKKSSGFSLRDWGTVWGAEEKGRGKEGRG